MILTFPKIRNTIPLEKKDWRTRLRELIGDNKTDKAFDYLREEELSTENQRTVTLLEAEYNALKQEEGRGLVGDDERQLRRNRIHDRLLALNGGSGGTAGNAATGDRNRYFRILIPIAVIALALLGWWLAAGSGYECPEYPEEYEHRVLVIPFVNLGGPQTNPGVLVRDRINGIAGKNDLSTLAQLGAPIENVSELDARRAAERCDATLVVWGKYTDGSDSIRILLEYLFIDDREENRITIPVNLRDVTAIQTGEVLMELSYAVKSVCGLIAIREGDTDLARKWFAQAHENTQNLRAKGDGMDNIEIDERIRRELGVE